MGRAPAAVDVVPIRPERRGIGHADEGAEGQAQYACRLRQIAFGKRTDDRLRRGVCSALSHPAPRSTPVPAPGLMPGSLRGDPSTVLAHAEFRAGASLTRN